MRTTITKLHIFASTLSHKYRKLEEKDLTKISSNLAPSTLTKVCRVHLEKRRAFTLSMYECEEGEWTFTFWMDCNRRLADLTKYEYVKEVVIKKYTFRPYEKPFRWEDSLEKTLRILPRYLRRPVIDLRRAGHDVSNLSDPILRNSLSKIPFVQLFIPYTCHRSEEFVRRQVSFRCLKQLAVEGESLPSMWNHIEELLLQPQVKFIRISNIGDPVEDSLRPTIHTVYLSPKRRVCKAPGFVSMLEAADRRGREFDFYVGLHRGAATPAPSEVHLRQQHRWISTDFECNIRGKGHPDFDLEEWSSDASSEYKCQPTQKRKTLCKSNVTFRGKGAAICVSQSGGEIEVYAECDAAWDYEIW
uniref:FBD domain-containing protein n=1 Tax=Steinernema glaseri TaxID=37863 RepID=A0A1I7YVA1_9BILA